MEATLEPPKSPPVRKCIAVTLLIIWEVVMMPLFLGLLILDILLFAVPFNRLPLTFHVFIRTAGSICPALTTHQSASYWLWRWILGREPFYQTFLETTPTPDESMSAA